MKDKKFTIVGGDLRNVKLADLIISQGNKVNIYGFNSATFDIGIEESGDLGRAIGEADVVIGPTPCSSDEETLNAPFHSRRIFINDIFKKMSKNQLFVAGRLGEKISQLADVYNVYTVDLLEREDMAVLNAIPTAEGAIQIAMEEMPITLHGSQSLVLGFGRVGKMTAKMLDGMGSNVHVEARKHSDIAWIRGYGYRPVFMTELADYIGKVDVIFNTIPCGILNRDMLEKVNKDGLIIDLASKPGGVDFASAKELGIKVIWALSLPGKVAPVTAAGFIKDTINNIITELGV